MPTPQERVASAVRFFFERALPEATTKTFAQLSSPRVHVGAYAPHTGGAVATSFGHSITPRFVLRASPAVSVAGGLPNPGTTVAAENAPARHLVWIRHVADPVADDEAEIRRVLDDFDSVETLFSGANAEAGEGGGAGAPAGGTSGAGGAAGSPVSDASARPVEWARGIKAAQASLPADLNALTAVPGPLAALAADVEALKQVLVHFFTYRANGTRYSRWSAAGRDASNPAHLTTDYKQENVREVVLERERVYLYAVVPESLLAGGGALDPTVFREVIIRFDETGVENPPYSLATVHTTRWRRNAAPHEDFVFVYTQLGAGIQYARELQAKMSARFIAFLGAVEAAGDDRASVFRAATHVLTETAEPELRLSALIDPPETPLPSFAVGDPDGEARNVQLPLSKVAEFVALPSVRHVDVVPPVTKFADLARAGVHYADLDAKIAGHKRGGDGVVVGIIDTGIDGSHLAFAGRIHSFWDQSSTPTVTGRSPKGNNPTVAAYASMGFGVEVTKTTSPQTVANAQDLDGHGTHVAGTAAGAEVRDAAGNVTVPAGFAPRATIVAVRCIGTDQQDFIAAAKYIFQKAAELSMPCVINMSFGGHFHAHDGSDVTSRTLFNTLTTNKNYRPGRIVIAAAGNERNNDMHIRRRITGNGRWRIGDIRIGAGLGQDWVNIWVRNPLQVCPLEFPLDLYVYRVTTPSNTLVTRAIRLGTSATEANAAGTFPAVKTQITVESSLSDVVNGDFNFQLTFRTTSPGSPATATTPATPALAMGQVTWRIMMVNASGHPLDVHMWIPAEWDAPATNSVFVDMIPADYAFMVGAPAASAAAISVAASNTRLSWTTPTGPGGPSDGTLGDIAVFSSPGPLRDSNVPPSSFYGVTHEINGVDVTAPGCMIQAARSSQWTASAGTTINAQSVVMRGTSMAAPAITGLIANVLAETPALTLSQALTLLKNASSIPAATMFHKPTAAGGAKPLSRDWGYGLVNAGLLKP